MHLKTAIHFTWVNLQVRKHIHLHKYVKITSLMVRFGSAFTLSRSERVESTSGGPTSRPSSLPDDFWLYVTLPRYKMADRTENILQGTQQTTQNVSDTSFPSSTSLKTSVVTVWLTVSWWSAGSRPSPSPAAVARSRAEDRPHLLS